MKSTLFSQPSRKNMDENAALVQDCFDQSEQSFVQRRAEARLWYLSYRMKYEPDVEAKLNNKYYTPLVYENVNSHMSLSVREPAIEITAAPGSDPAMAEKIQAWQAYMWYIQNMDEKRKDLYKYLFISGNGILRHFYRVTEKTMIRNSYRDKNIRKKEKVTIYDGPDCEIVNHIDDFFPDPWGWDIESCRFIIHRKIIPLDMVDEYYERGIFNVEKNKENIKEYYDERRRDQDRVEKITEIFGDTYNITYMKENSFEIMDFWTDKQHIIVANRQYVVFEDDNPYPVKPFTNFKLERMPHEFWGIGDAEALKQYAGEMNTIRRAGIDNVKRAARGKLIAKQGTLPNVDAWDDEDEPVTWTLGDPNQTVTPWIFPNLEQVGVITCDQLNRDAQKAAGISDFIKGQSDQDLQGDTATTAKLMQANSQGALYRVLDDCNNGIANWMKMNVLMMACHGSESYSYLDPNNRNLGIITLPHEAFLGGYHYWVKSSAALPLSRQDEIWQAQTQYQMLAGNPLVDQRALLLDTLKKLRIDNPEAMLKTEEQVMQEQQAAAEQAQHQAAQAAKMQQEIDMENNIMGEAVKSTLGGGGQEEMITL